MDFSDSEIVRYSRHILLREIGGTGQAKLRGASVLIIGAGGLGSPAALYLAAAGVGRIGIADHDVLELSNLQRQIAHRMAGIGTSKAVSAAAAMHAINPDITIVPIAVRVDANTIDELVASYDIVLDGTDNFATRFIVADACVRGRKTLISAAVLRFEGQIATFKPHQDVSLPCYRCLYPEAPAAGVIPSCAEAGVLGPVTGVMGALQATEAMKEILGIGISLAGRLLLWDALDMRFRMITVPRDPGCFGCSTQRVA